MTDAPHSEEWVLADAFDRAAPDLRRHGRPLPGLPRPAAHRGRGARRPAARPRPGDGGALRVLDLGCGSGASTRALLDAWASRGGLGRRPLASPASTPPRAWSRRPAPSGGPRASTLVVSDAVAHLESLPSGSVDGVLAAYLLRNVPDRDAARRARWPACCGPGAPSSSTTTPSPAAPARGRCGRRCATASSSRWPWSSGPTCRCTATSTRACATSTRSHAICERLQSAPASSTCRHRSYPGWQHGLVHTVAGSAPS